MAGDSLQLVVVTPVRQLLSESVTEVQLPGADGYLGVLPGHAPLITELGIGELTYRTTGGQAGLLAVIRGFAEVLPDNTPMLEVFGHSGFPMTSRREPGVVHVTLRLT